MVVHATSLNSAIHSMYRSIMAAAASERSHLSATAVEYVFVPATRLGSSFDLLVPVPILAPEFSKKRSSSVAVSHKRAFSFATLSTSSLLNMLSRKTQPPLC